MVDFDLGTRDSGEPHHNFYPLQGVPGVVSLPDSSQGGTVCLSPDGDEAEGRQLMPRDPRRSQSSSWQVQTNPSFFKSLLSGILSAIEK